MIKKYTQVSIAKIADHQGKEKTPTHAIKAREKDSNGKPITVGKLWTKDGQYGKFLSGVMSNPAQVGDKFYDGFVIVSEVELDKLITLNNELNTKLGNPLGKDYPTETIDDLPNPADIPF